MWDEYFRGKKITLMGLGLLGRGVGDAVFLATHGAELIVTDQKDETALAGSVAQLKEFPNVTFHLGGHRMEDFARRDLIVRAANVPLDSPFLQEAQKNNIPIEQSVSLFARLLRQYKERVGRGDEKYLVGVTGSKGKTTTTHLIFEMLSRAFPEKRVRMGGNIQGVSTLAYLDDLRPDDLFVLELDSWQLQSFGDARMSPHVSVFTTFLPDHMNYYRGDMDRYFNDKAHIFCFQGEGDVCFVGEAVGPWIEKHHAHDVAKVLSPVKRLYEKISRSLLGVHNEENIACAAAAAHALGVPERIIEDVVAGFKGVAGRLQFIGEKDGVSYYNDTTATMPEATRAALKALHHTPDTQPKIILIFGGADKQLDASALVRELPDACRALVLLKGTGTEKIRELIDDARFEHVAEVENMRDAVKTAKEFANKGDIILLSPAFASFGMFTNEYDRGQQFDSAVHAVR
jgi:UDP-N-acetylmuramoylalanine--D-glutamate ligase